MDRGMRTVLVATDLSPVTGVLLSTAAQVACADGRTGIRRALVGSVAEEVLRHAHRPVLVIPQAVPEAARPREGVAL